MKKVQSRLYVFLLCVMILAVIGTVKSLAELDSASNVSQNVHPEYTPGVMILKFKADSPLAAVAAELFQKGERFASRTGSTDLDELNHKYQVQKITKRDQVSRSIEEIKKKFPQRTKRIPPSAQVPDLGNTYILEFKDKHIDIPALCAQYAKNSHVEYAQPDFRMTIHEMRKRGQ